MSSKAHHLTEVVVVGIFLHQLAGAIGASDAAFLVATLAYSAALTVDP